MSGGSWKLSVPRPVLSQIKRGGNGAGGSQSNYCKKLILTALRHGLWERMDLSLARRKDCQKVSVWFNYEEISEIREAQNIIMSDRKINIRPGELCARVLRESLMPLNFEKDATADNMAPTKPPRHTSDHRSKPQYNLWKNKDTENWNDQDFVGYYMSKYVELDGKDDPFFLNTPAHKMMFILSSMKGVLNRVFYRDATQLREFIDWYFEFKKQQRDGEIQHWTGITVSFWDIVKKVDIYYKTWDLIREGHEPLRKKEKSVAERESEYGSVEYWNKKGNVPKATERMKFWNKVSILRTRMAKKAGLTDPQYMMKYYSKDKEVFDKIVPEGVSKEEMPQFLKVLMTKFEEFANEKADGS